MANKVLNEVISGSLTWEDFVSWVKPKNEYIPETLMKFDCSQGDFVIYFVNLLHDEVSSILQKWSRGNHVLKRTANFPINDKRNAAFNGRNERATSSPVDQSKQTAMQRGSGNSKGSPVISYNVSKESLDSGNKKFLRCYSILNGTVKSNNDHQNNSYKVKQNMSNSSVVRTEKGCDSTFLQSCQLSPIASELISTTKEKYSGCVSEVDSSNNRMVRRDSKSGSRRISSERTTSSPSFNLGDHSFPAVGSPAKQDSSRRRRIKPTRLADTFEKGKEPADQNRAPNFGEVVRPLEPSAPFREDATLKEIKESPETDFRDLLRLEKQKLQQNAWGNTGTSGGPQPAAIVIASPESVKFKDELCILAKIYNILLDSNLICNIVTEIHFIISLLNVQEGKELDSCNSKELVSLGYFVSIHECVFFATAVLNQQRLFLSTLDKATLKLLLNNKRISLFVPDLWKYLCDLHQSRKDIRSFVGSSAFHTSVCFQSDTDNRENFPNDRTFVTFRKQRDAFYEILGIWEENHSSPGWSFGVALGQRVRNLLCMNDEPANFIHFARLFRTQLLGSSWKSGSAAVEEEPGNAFSEVLKCLKEGNPDKYSRLYERLVTPVKSPNSCTVQDFPDEQEFYKDFIVYGCHALFNAHLIDSLWHQIELLNSSEFSASEVEEGILVDKDTKEAFVTCVRNLQLLAKFLGFVVFLPYRSNNKMSEHLMEKQKFPRVKAKPPIDVLACIQEAIHTKKLTLTIPWTAQFMSMVDNVSCNLLCYREAISLLFSVYRTLPTASIHSPYGSFMLKVCLGWLFERPQLPEDLFYTWSLNESQNCEYSVKTENSRSMVAAIDELDLLEWDTLHILCPNLETIKWVIVSDNNNVKNVVPPRHITPVLVATEQIEPTTSIRNIELQLEETFLEGQPQSLRKTVEFVTERIASSCVKHICGKPLLEVKEKALKMLEATLDSDDKGSLITNMPLETTSLSQELKKNCHNIVPKLCFGKCKGIMPLLLAEDVPEEVIHVCVQMAVRLSIDKVNVWINSHITPALFTKHLSTEMDKVSRSAKRIVKSSHVLPRGWREISEKDLEDAIPPAATIIIIRKFIYDVTGQAKIEEKEVLSVLRTVKNTLQSRKDLIPSAERVIGVLTVDLAISLVAHHPEMIKETVLKSFLCIWKSEEVATSHCFQHLICPRNIMILNHSKRNKKAWSAAAHFLYFVLKNNIVPPNDFESQCVAVFRQNWPMETLKNLASCFEEVVKQYQRDSCDANFVLLLELVSDLCREMDSEDF